MSGELDKLTPWQWVKAAGLGVASLVWCGYFLVSNLVADEAGWLKVLFATIFTLLLGFNLWQLPRSVRSYRRMVTSTRRMGESRARFLRRALLLGYPPEIVLRVDQMIMAQAPAGDIKAVLDEHRPRRRWRAFGLN